MKGWICINKGKVLTGFLVIVICINIYFLMLLPHGISMKGQAASVIHVKVTLLIREFENHENTLENTVKSAIRKVDQIIVVADKLPYPPVKIPQDPSVSLVVLSQFPEHKKSNKNLSEMIMGDYILVVPDGTRIDSGSLRKILKSAKEDALTAIPLQGYKSFCSHMRFITKHWTLKFTESGRTCNYVSGKHAILVPKVMFVKILPPERPINDYVYVMSHLHGWTVKYQPDSHFSFVGQSLFKDSHSAWKHKTQEFQRQKHLFKQMGIKLVQKEDGSEQWFGCEKNTARCFGTVVNNMPEYIYAGRWTPPCCLKHLRTTARHAFKTLESQGVRYWLEGGSLLGAARHADIIPWDYDLDIGIHKSDLIKSPHLLAAQEKGSYEDTDGFVWEKAKEGDFYRVQFSQSNHLHIDIFPFYSKNGIMTKDTWFKTHKQDREFPEHFLQPLIKVPFIGIDAYAPNNVREFLEFKFGKGVIENPRYPDNSNSTG